MNALVERKLELEIQQLELDVASKQISLDERRAVRNRRVTINDVHQTSSLYAIRALDAFVCESSEPITLVITSPGGSVFDGLGLYDYIQTVRAEGVHVTTQALGWAASMGGILLQAGDVRQMTANSYLMIHEVASGSWGKTSDMRDEVELMAALEERCLGIIASRSKLTLAAIKKRCARKDWWLSADEAFKFKFIDEVVR